MSGPRRVTPGEILRGIRASDHNAFVQTWERVRQLPPSAFGSDNFGARRFYIAVENTTGGLIDVDFPVLQIDGPLYTPNDRAEVIREGIVVAGKTPASGVTIGDVVIVQGPISSGDIREAVLLGPTWCDVNVTNASHLRAKPQSADSAKLVSDPEEGAPILWKGTGTGVMKALINLVPQGGGGGGFNRCKAQAKGAFTGANATITVDNVIAEHGPNPTANVSEELQVRNRYEYAGADNDLMTIAFDQSIAPGSGTPQWYLLQKGC